MNSNKTNKMRVVGQFPSNAHATLPEDTPTVTISTHVATRRGFINAVKSVRRMRGEYIHSHGNAAAFAIWIEYRGKRYSDPFHYDFYHLADDLNISAIDYPGCL